MLGKESRETAFDFLTRTAVMGQWGEGLGEENYSVTSLLRKSYSRRTNSILVGNTRHPNRSQEKINRW